VYPITFGIPEELVIHDAFIFKEDVVAAAVPGHPYRFHSQSQYFRQYRKSLVGITHKKGGWDCLRHYEIVAAGSLPYMPDVGGIPEGTMALWPKDLLNEVLELPGLDHKMIANKNVANDTLLINEAFNIDRYVSLLNRFTNYTLNCLTTRAVAEFILSTVEVNTAKDLKILYITMQDDSHADYLADTILHGMRAMFPDGIIDIPKRGWIYQKSNVEDEEKERPGLYGRGFSYAYLSPDVPIRRDGIEDRLTSKEFDVVIYGDTYLAKNQVDKLDYFEIVKKFYNATQVVFLDGSDTGHPETGVLFEHICGRHATCFRRELNCKP
jgi:hypothetical protein